MTKCMTYASLPHFRIRVLAHRLDFADVDADPCTRNQPAAVHGGCYIGCVEIFAMLNWWLLTHFSP